MSRGGEPSYNRAMPNHLTSRHPRNLLSVPVVNQPSLDKIMKSKSNLLRVLSATATLSVASAAERKK